MNKTDFLSGAVLGFGLTYLPFSSEYFWYFLGGFAVAAWYLYRTWIRLNDDEYPDSPY